MSNSFLNKTRDDIPEPKKLEAGEYIFQFLGYDEKFIGEDQRPKLTFQLKAVESLDEPDLNLKEFMNVYFDEVLWTEPQERRMMKIIENFFTEDGEIPEGVTAKEVLAARSGQNVRGILSYEERPKDPERVDAKVRFLALD